MRASQLPIVLALLLAACESSSSGPSAGPTASATAVATATATTPSASASASAAPAAPPAEPSPDALPENAAIHFEWFAFASRARDGHKLWLDWLVTKKPPVLMLSYLPDAGKAPPDKEVSEAQRGALVRVIQAAKIGTRKPVHRGKEEGVVPTYNYLLSVSWPREGGPPASYSFAWTDLTETADLAAVRKAMYELGSAKFPVVARAMLKP
ncbi:MAG: hypothetical protein QM820_23360 [Minicystis sp.]